MAKSPLQEIILEMIDREINEMVKEEGILPDKPGPAAPTATNPNAPPSGDSTPVDASPDFGAPMDAGSPGGSTSDMGAAMGAGGAGPTGAPGGGAGGGGLGGLGDSGGSPEDAPGGDDAGGGDSGGMGDSGGLGSGFGGGSGGGGDMGLDDSDSDTGDGDSAPASPDPTYDPFKDAKTPEDRLQVILDTAEGIAETTQDPQKVLKAVKGLIQNGFAEPQKAATIIAQLFDTENPVLQQVSRRLALFIDGI